MQALSYLRPNGPPPPPQPLIRANFAQNPGVGGPSSEMCEILLRISKDILHIYEEGGPQGKRLLFLSG